MIALTKWALKHGVTPHALFELEGILTGHVPQVVCKPGQNAFEVFKMPAMDIINKEYIVEEKGEQE